MVKVLTSVPYCIHVIFTLFKCATKVKLITFIYLIRSKWSKFIVQSCILKLFFVSLANVQIYLAGEVLTQEMLNDRKENNASSFFIQLDSS